MRHLDLFSGIGGFALAALKVWGKEYECVGFCDIDAYAQQLLKIRFPGVRIYDDIKTLTAERIIADADSRGQEVKKQQTAGHKQCDRRIDLLTGGFPCQPFSMAGKRRGTEDDRYLWPEMLRVIREVKPTWVIGENVAGILTMGGYNASGVEGETDNGEEGTSATGANGIVWGIINDLESLGYAIQAFIIPACATKFPENEYGTYWHRRDRIWIVANAGRGNGERNKKQGEYGQENKKQTASKPERPIKCDESRVAWDTQSTGQPSGANRQRKVQFWRADTGKNWLEVATRLCGVDDGVSAELDGFKLSKAGHRIARLKGLGNAIVPQVAEEIMKAIKITMEQDNG